MNDRGDEPGAAAQPGAMRALRRRIGDRLLRFYVARSRRAALALSARLIDLRRYDDADAMLEAALVRWPGRPRLLHLYATSAHSAGRFGCALERWKALRKADATAAAAWGGVAANLRMLDDLRGAEATVREALTRFPDDLGVATEAARVFGQLGRFAEAATQWRRLLDLEPVHRDWYQGYALCLVMTGRFEEAEAILDRAAAPYPDDRDLLGVRAMLAMERQDWNAALAHWRLYRERYPEDEAGYDGNGMTLAAIHAARLEAPKDAPDAVKVDIEAIEDDPLRTLVLGFESIGADCEFGLVQRRFGAEPLGLLRFNDTRLVNILPALAARFEGMGEPENTSLVVSRSGEYFVSDRRWNLGMHTFLFESRHDAAVLLPKMCRRVVYLRGKFLEDLRAAEKVFVFKSDAIDLDGLRLLHAALRAFGPVRLLHVRRAAVPLDDRPYDVAPGQVRELEEDLYVGFLSRMGNASPAWDIAFDEWIAICRGMGAPMPRLA